MLKTILVGLDGSKYSQSAVNVAIQVSQKIGCRVHGIGIIDRPAIFERSPGVAGSMHYKENADRAQYENARKRIEGFFKDFETRCKESGVVHEVVCREGSPLEELVDISVSYDLLVLGQKTFFTIEQSEGPGDTLESLLKNTPRPVLVVPAGATYAFERPAIIAYDDSICAARSMQLFTLLSHDDPTNEIHVVTATKTPERGEERLARAALYLERWYGRKPVTKAIHRTSNHSRAIMDYARENNARVLIMGAYGKKGLKNFFFGSCTRDILKDSNCLLFLYH